MPDALSEIARHRPNAKRRRLEAFAGGDAMTISKSNPLMIVCHPAQWHNARQFDFRTLGNFLCSGKANQIAVHIAERLIRLARCTAISRYLAIRAFLDQATAIFNKPGQSYFQSLTHREGRGFWTAVYRLEFSRIRAKKIKLTSQAEMINALNIFVDELADSGLGPALDRSSMPGNYHGAAGRRRSLLELNDKALTSATESAIKRMRDDLKQRGVEIDDEGDRFLASLIDSPRLQNLVDEQSIYAALLDEHRERLARLRAAAEQSFCYWQDIYKNGELAMAEPHTPEFLQIAKLLDLANVGTEFGKRLFPATSATTATRNMLSICVKFYDSTVPSQGSVSWKPRFLKAVRLCGGIYHLDAMLFPHRQAIACALILYLIDSGANPSTALQMRTDFEEATDDSNLIKVRSYKPRSGYQSIVDTLPVKDKAVKVTAVEALRFIRESTAKRRSSDKDLGDYLFTFRFFSTTSVASYDFISNHMSYLAMDQRLPSCWTPGAIRQSVAMEYSSKNLASLRGVARKLKHRPNSSQTPFYALSFPIRGLLEQIIKHYQQVYQTSIADNLADGLSHLGYDANDMKRLREQVQRTGLGVLCLRRVGVPEMARDDRPCGKVGLCPGCEKHLFVANENSIAELIATKEVLWARRQQLESEEPGRWAFAWVHLLAFCIVVLERIQRSSHARYLDQAQVIARKLVSAGFDPTTLRPKTTE